MANKMKVRGAGRAVVMGLACLGAASASGEVGAAETIKIVPDGFISDADACQGSADLFSQDGLLRPWGGFLLVPASLSSDKRAAIQAAANARLAVSGAIWHLVTVGQPVGVGLDGILVASCGVELPGFSWVQQRPTGSIGVRWEAQPQAQWAAGLAQSLALAEGDGPL